MADKLVVAFGPWKDFIADGGNPQVSQSLIGVSELAAPDLMIEIKVVAHV